MLTEMINSSQRKGVILPSELKPVRLATVRRVFDSCKNQVKLDVTELIKDVN